MNSVLTLVCVVRGENGSPPAREWRTRRDYYRLLWSNVWETAREPSTAAGVDDQDFYSTVSRLLVHILIGARCHDALTPNRCGAAQDFKGAGKQFDQ